MFYSTYPIPEMERKKIIFLYQNHRGKTDDWPMMSHPKDVSTDSFVCYQVLSKYVGLGNIKQEFHGEPALKKHYKTLIWTLTSSSATAGHFWESPLYWKKR